MEENTKELTILFVLGALREMKVEYVSSSFTAEPELQQCVDKLCALLNARPATDFESAVNRSVLHIATMAHAAVCDHINNEGESKESEPDSLSCGMEIKNAQQATLVTCVFRCSASGPVTPTQAAFH